MASRNPADGRPVVTQIKLTETKFRSIVFVITFINKGGHPMTVEEFATKGAELKNALALQRLVGLKFCKSLEEVPPKARHPLRDMKYHMAICQAVNQARTVTSALR
jgi:hypothetical protein